MAVSLRAQIIARALIKAVQVTEPLFIDPVPAVVNSLQAAGVEVTSESGGALVAILGRIDPPHTSTAFLLLVDSILDGQSAGLRALARGERQKWILDNQRALSSLSASEISTNQQTTDLGNLTL